MRADEAAESVSCPPLCHPLCPHSPVSAFSLSRLRAYLPRLPVQHVIIEPVAALCRLLQLQYRAAPWPPLSRSPPTRRVSHSGALDGESIDLRDTR